MNIHSMRISFPAKELFLFAHPTGRARAGGFREALPPGSQPPFATSSPTGREGEQPRWAVRHPDDYRVSRRDKRRQGAGELTSSPMGSRLSRVVPDRQEGEHNIPVLGDSLGKETTV